MGVIPSPNEVLYKYRNLVKASPRLAGFLKLDYLPYVKYQVYEKWKPDRVRVLFVAESPPWKGNVYFLQRERSGWKTRRIKLKPIPPSGHRRRVEIRETQRVQEKKFLPPRHDKMHLPQRQRADT